MILILNLILYLIQQFFMSESGMKEGEYARLRGRNFEGEIELTGNSLKLRITEFRKGGIYSVELTNETLEKEFKRFLIFRKVDDLFNELVSNENLEISDEQGLILPIEVIYKEKIFQLKVQIQLQEEKYKNDNQKLQALYKHIANMNRFYMNLQKEKSSWEKNSWEKQNFSLKKKTTVLQAELVDFKDKFSKEKTQISELIRFRGDESNEKYKSFETTQNKVKMLATTQYVIYNHNEVLPKSGIFHFKLKTTRITSKHIYVGICGKNIKNLINAEAYNSPYFMGYNFTENGYFQANKKSIDGAGPLNLTQDSVIKVQINLNQNNLIWYFNEERIYLGRIPKELFDVHLHPFVMLYANGDTVEFLDN